MIEGYVGRPGSGKSYTLTARALELAGRGRTVFANYPIAAENCWTFRPEQLLDLPPGVIVIDEAHLWFPARMSLKLPSSWLAMLSQTRKNGWDLLWCAQHEARVDRVIRDVSSWMYLCSAWFKWKDHPLFFKTECFEPEFFRNAKHSMGTRRRRFDPKVAAAYDTFERLVTAEHTNSDSDIYAAASVTEQARRAASRIRAVVALDEAEEVAS